jgi:putative transposase
VESVKAVRAVRFQYTPREDVRALLVTFKDMVNEALRIGFEKKPRSRFQLIMTIYYDFKQKYGLHTHYILGACECAFAMLRNRRWRKCPYARKLFLKLDNQSYRLDYMLLRIPTAPRRFITIPLKAGNYQLSFLRDASLKRGSITITDSTIVLAVTKTASVVEPLRKPIAYDINEKNITSSDGEQIDLSHVAQIKHQYSRIRASIAASTCRDRRINKRLLGKYGARERQRTKQALHIVSKQIVEKAKQAHSPIVLERLTHIRRSMLRGNGQGRKMRGRLNRWSFRELQRQIEYKAQWEGIPVKYVGASMTSKTCSRCGYRNKALKWEKCWTCPNCGIQHDRDLNAALNILSRFKEPNVVRSADEGLASEAMVQLATVSRG